MILRGAASSRAAVSALKRLIEVESPAITEPFGAPIEGADAVADAGRQVDPAGGVPRADQLAAPALVEFAAHPFSRADLRHRSERIAVEIDDALRQVEHRSRALEEIVDHRRDLSWKRWILPVCVFGKASRKRTARGYL